MKISLKKKKSFKWVFVLFFPFLHLKYLKYILELGVAILKGCGVAKYVCVAALD